MLYYTGAIQHLAIQTDPSKSLGGYISSSQIPNDVLGNLFPVIDNNTLENNLKHTRVIAYLNTFSNAIGSLRVYTNTPSSSFSKLKVGLIVSSVDSTCNIPYFESLPSENATPFYVALQDAEGATNAVELNNILPNQYVGVFLQRELIPTNNNELEENGSVKQKSCEDFYTEYKSSDSEIATNIVQKDNIEIVFLIDE